MMEGTPPACEGGWLRYWFAPPASDESLIAHSAYSLAGDPYAWFFPTPFRGSLRTAAEAVSAAQSFFDWSVDTVATMVPSFAAHGDAAPIAPACDAAPDAPPPPPIDSPPTSPAHSPRRVSDVDLALHAGLRRGLEALRYVQHARRAARARQRSALARDAFIADCEAVSARYWQRQRQAVWLHA